MKNFTLFTKQIVIVATLIGVVSLSSCYKDYFETDKYTVGEYKPGLAVPLVHSKLTIENMAPNGLGAAASIASDFFVTLIYSSTRKSPSANEMFPIPKQTFGDNISINSTDATQINSGGASKTVTGNANFTTNGEQLAGIAFSEGILNVTVSNGVSAGATVIFSLPATMNNGPVSLSIPVSSNGSATASLDLSGYTSDLSPTTGQSNLLQYSYTAQFSNGSGASAGQSVQISATISGISFSRLSGNFGTKTVNLQPDTTVVALYNHALLPGTFNIIDPQLIVTLTSDMVLPASTQASLLLGYSNNVPAMNFFAPTLSSTMAFVSPTVAGQSASASFYANNDNGSTIKSVVDGKRNFVVTDFDPTINPNGTNTLNEVLGDGHFSIKKELELPLRGLAFNFSLQDTFDFEFGEDVTKIKEALFRIAIINGFPADAHIQLFFADENSVILDSLLYFEDQRIILSAPIDENGKAIGKTPKTTDILVDGNRMARLKNGRKVILRGWVVSTGQGTKNVRIYSSDEIDVKLGMQVKVALNEFKK